MADKRLKDVEQIIERHWSDWSITSGGKHLRLVIRLDGVERRMPIPGSPSDVRSLKNWETQLKRKIQELKDAAAAQKGA